MIFSKVIDIYQKYYICSHCLGRMFSLLGTSTTNYERGNSLLLVLTMENHRNYLSGNEGQQKEAIFNLKVLAENAYYFPAQKVLINEGLDFIKKDPKKTCYLCHDIFSNSQTYVNRTIQALEEFEFNNFLIGSSPKSQIINQEDIFKTEFNLLEAESFKSHFNRTIGKNLMIPLKKDPEFTYPDILIIFSIGFETFKVELVIKSIFIFAKYNKLLRGIPQTHWFCKNCNGEGCELCNFSGKQYLISVEDLITPEFIKESKATESRFHGAGREDIDVRMLGSGRPFILELRNPKVRNLDLNKIEKKVNKTNKKKIKIQDLRYSNKKEVIKIKSEAKDTKKVYRAKVEAIKKISKEIFDQKVIQLKNTFENKEIHQRTPHRVSHRRADKIRKKMVFKIEEKFIKANIFEFTIKTQGGTYIKELINGDNGRTSPSFSEIFDIPLICKELDVLKILH